MPQATTSNGLGRIATGAAIGLMAGLALPQARKAMMQAPSLTAGDWVAALKAEHRAVEKMFRKVLGTSENETAAREMLLTKIAYALNKHAVEEENVIYPALSEGGHADQSQHLSQEHAQVKTFIYDLRRISSKDPQWLAKAEEFWAALQRHIHEEENDVFPAFHEAIGSDENARLTRMLNWEGYKVA